MLKKQHAKFGSPSSNGSRNMMYLIVQGILANDLEVFANKLIFCTWLPDTIPSMKPKSLPKFSMRVFGKMQKCHEKMTFFFLKTKKYSFFLMKFKHLSVNLYVFGVTELENSHKKPLSCFTIHGISILQQNTKITNISSTPGNHWH